MTDLDRKKLKGLDLIGSDWRGQEWALRSIDSTGLEPVAEPFSPFEQFLGRMLVWIHYHLQQFRI